MLYLLLPFYPVGFANLTEFLGVRKAVEYRLPGSATVQTVHPVGFASGGSKLILYTDITRSYISIYGITILIAGYGDFIQFHSDARFIFSNFF